MITPFKEENSKGRRYPEKSMYGRPFLIDFERIIESKAYRRLSEKTQAFSLPEHSHIRTRSKHTNEVIATSIKISEGLGLNTDLSMAIAAGHDIGHVSFGHLGERVLEELGTGNKEFRHATYGVVLAQEIEDRGRGLNLNYETLEGMLLHAKGKGKLNMAYAKPAEYNIVMLADKIAYTFGDYSDANRCEYFPKEKHADLVENINKYLGKETKERRHACVNALILESKKIGQISFSAGVEYDLFKELRDALYQDVYPAIDGELHEATLRKLHKFIKTNKDFKEKYNNFDPTIFISLLTDREVTSFGHLLFKSKNIELKDINHFGAFELLPELKNKKIDYSNAGLDW